MIDRYGIIPENEMELLGILVTIHIKPILNQAMARRVTGPLWGESNGHRWIPLAKASDAELWFVFNMCLITNGWTNNRDAGDLGRHGTHCDVTVMLMYGVKKMSSHCPLADEAVILNQ